MMFGKNRIRAMKGKKDDERKNAIIEIKEVQHCMSNVLPVEDLSKTYPRTRYGYQQFCYQNRQSD